MTTPLSMPPFSTLLKSRDVEDPINTWVHRPLAYAFCWLVFATPMTPNAITFLAMAVGMVAGGCFLVGTKAAMLAGGILLWTSAILDGADGILARAKNMQSDLGRALDGFSDTLVAVATVFPAFWHVWVKDQNLVHVSVMIPAIALTAVHLWCYDYYKESYLRMTRLDRGGEGEDIEEMRRKAAVAHERGPFAVFLLKHVMVPYLESEARVIRTLNPASWREGVQIRRSEESARIYKDENYRPMQLWTIVSLAPHSYLMAICAMLDRLDVYLFIRLVVMNVFFFFAVRAQRRATANTNEAFVRIGAMDPR
jgi:phosphatidylglycerophosphate synthase